MKEIITDIEINASAERVWQVLTDFAAYPQWNPFIRRAKGEAKAGARLKVYIQPSGAQGMSFRPTVLKAEPNRELRWLGHLLDRAAGGEPRAFHPAGAIDRFTRPVVRAPAGGKHSSRVRGNEPRAQGAG